MAIKLIINPKACSGSNEHRLQEILDFFKSHHLKIDAEKTAYAGNATTIARKAAKSYEIVIAAGGDGTINEVINGLANTKTKMGILPLGTENVLAYELGIPLSLKEACKVILFGNKKTIDLGKANKRYFVLMAGIGLDAQVASEVRPMLKKLLGGMAYPLTGLGTLFKYNPDKLHVKIDNQIMERTGYFVVVGNAKHYGRIISIKQYTKRAQVTPFADLVDGYLDVCIFKNKDVLSVFRYVMEVALGDITKTSDIEYFKAKKITIRAEKKQALAHVDCEILGTTPLTITICPQALHVLVPKAL